MSSKVGFVYAWTNQCLPLPIISNDLVRIECSALPKNNFYLTLYKRYISMCLTLTLILFQGGFHRRKSWCASYWWLTAKQKFHVQMSQGREWYFLCQFTQFSPSKISVCLLFSYTFSIFMIFFLNGLTLLWSTHECHIATFAFIGNAYAGELCWVMVHFFS